MIYGPKNDGTYIVEFKTSEGEALAISVPAGETRVLKYFQERMNCIGVGDWNPPRLKHAERDVGQRNDCNQR
jgi:hypothetical protein